MHTDTYEDETRTFNTHAERETTRKINGSSQTSTEINMKVIQGDDSIEQ